MTAPSILLPPARRTLTGRRGTGPEPLDPGAAAVPLLLQPHPVYVIDGTYDVLSRNPATEKVFPGLVTADGRPPNFARWVFLEPLAREVLVDWEPEARGLLARMRTLAGARPGDPRFGRLVDELHEGSPEVRAWWPQFEVEPRGGGHKRLRSPDGDVVTYAYTAFHVAGRPEQTLVIYVARAPGPSAPAAPEVPTRRSRPAARRGNSASPTQ